MPADIDILLGGNSPIGFAPRYSFKSEVHDYNVSSEILNSESSSSPFVSRSSPLDFPTALSSSPTSGSYLGHSPPIFSSSSPPTHFTFHGRCSSPTLRAVSPSSITLARNFNQLRLSSSDSHQMPVAVPRRPCLVVRCDVLDLPSPNKSKKKVVFADDRGFPLTLVRTMTEPSNVPPQLSLQFLANMTRGSKAEPVSEPWEVTFPQPASDYLDFRRRLDTNNVSLENVIVKENEQVVLGTVKVRNLAFEKDVIIRTTSDNWKTYEDVYCTYVPNSPPSHGVTILYDTFSFRLPLPAKSRKIEFCVCFKCSGTENWDNNSGKNYFIIKKDAGTKQRASLSQSENFESSSDRKINLPQKFSDDLKPNTQLDSWSEFASWNHLNNNTPYW